jgi:HNH endonuclease
VDVCHVRPVSDFPPSATLGEVNAPENLVALDKRCHWEFDHGHLRRTPDGDFAPAQPI